MGSRDDIKADAKRPDSPDVKQSDSSRADVSGSVNQSRADLKQDDTPKPNFSAIDDSTGLDITAADTSVVTAAGGNDAKGVEESIQFAKKYLEDLLSFFGLNTDVYATTEDNEVIELHVPSTQYNAFLIGQHGDTMRALQYTVSATLKNNNYQVSRVNVDVADYKKARAERLVQTAEDWVKQVVSSGEPMELMPMNGADRRIIHKLASDNGLLTESVGEGRDRHVVLKPAGGATGGETDTDQTTQAEKNNTDTDTE